MRKLTKREVLIDFNEMWAQAVRANPRLRGDVTWKREEWNNYVDRLQKDRLITQAQAETWTNPF